MSSGDSFIGDLVSDSKCECRYLKSSFTTVFAADLDASR